MSINKRTLGRLKISVVVFFFVVCAGGVYVQRAARAAGEPQKKAKGAAQVERGRTVYMQNCARCHGADGRSQTEQGELYGATVLADAGWWRTERVNDRRLTNVIVNGKKGGMPAYGKRLSKDDIAAVVAFVRTLKQ
jgi:cbb3-type cytochrome c oxidase subunit III